MRIRAAVLERLGGEQEIQELELAPPGQIGRAHV